MKDLSVAAAVKAKMTAITNFANLMPGGVTEPPIPEPTPDMPYTSLLVTKDPRPNKLSSGGKEIDYRQVDIGVFGLDKEQVADLLDLIDGALSEQELTIEDGDWMRTEPVEELRGGTIERGERNQYGVVWKGRLKYRVWQSLPKE